MIKTFLLTWFGCGLFTIIVSIIIELIVGEVQKIKIKDLYIFLVFLAIGPISIIGLLITIYQEYGDKILWK